MNQETAQTVIAAGGVVPPSIHVDTEIPLDPVAARSWSHPGLAEPVVLVDLTALAAARDLEMEFLGFEAPSDLGEVGKQPRRALGFPGSAIVSDPDNAGFALEVVKELRKAARRAQSKPGHAKTEIDDIGERLGKSVPHFLPSFYEEACRIFLEAGNKTYAGQMFEKAREAERVHALEVDETLRENTFVEFALAGALAIKSLTNYARELASSADPVDAYQTFRRVCVKRTLGGLPPWAKMSAELKRLAKAAGLDVAVEERSVLAEIIDAPSLSRTVAGFWKPYSKSLVALCKEQPRVRRQLLELFPSVDCPTWLDLLDQCGALAGITDPDAGPEVKPGGRIGAWFERLVSFGGGWRDQLPERAFDLLEQAAPILRAEGEPLNLLGRYHDGDLDLIELAFDLELPMAAPDENASLGYLPQWAESAGQPRRGRDPVRIAADERYATLLAGGIDRYLGGEPLTELALERDGFRGAIGAWLTNKLDAVESGGALPDLYDTIRTLQSQATGKVWTAFPEQLARLERCSVAPALAATLRIGIFDEHGWATYDEVIDRFPEDAELTIAGAFPRVVVSDGVRAIVVGPREVVAEIDLQLPANSRLQSFAWSQDQLMVIFRDMDTYETRGYWSANPGEIFEVEGGGYYYGSGGHAGVILGDGSLVAGDRAHSAGDRWTPGGSAITDGESFWIVDGDWQNRHFREVDPRTGKRGRKSMPAFFESFQREGMTLHAPMCWLYTLPEGVTGTPLGQDGGLCGFRVRLRDAESPLAASVPWRECERADGVSWTEPEPLRHNIPEALITFPGDDAPRPVFSSWRSLSIVGPDAWVVGSNTNRHYRRGTRSLAPLAWWGAFEARDPQGSAALRQATAEQAEAVIAAGRAAREAAERDKDNNQPIFAFEGADLEAAIESIFAGAITHPRLRRGVGGLAWMAAGDAERLGALVESASSAAEKAGAELAVDPPALSPALSDFGSFGAETRAIAEIPRVAQMFAELEDGELRSIPEGSGADWESLIGAQAALAYRCAVAVTPGDHRDAILALLDAYAASPFVDRAGELRLFTTARLPAVYKGATRIFGLRQGASRYFGWRNYGDSTTLLEWAEGGEFQLPDGCESIESETRPRATWGSAGDVAALRARLESDGPVDTEPLAAIVAGRTGHTPTEAQIVAAGLHGSGLQPTKATQRRTDLARAGTGVSTAERIAILSDAMTADPDAPWSDPEAFAANLAAAWLAHKGPVPVISEDVLEDLEVELKRGDTADHVRAVADPSRGPLATDGAFALDENNYLKSTQDAPYFDQDTLLESMRVIAYLAAYAPAGDPARAAIPEAMDAIRARLACDTTWLRLADLYWSDEDRDAILADIGGEPIAGTNGEIPHSAQTDCFMLLPTRYDTEIYIRPRALRDEAARVDQFVALSGWPPTWPAFARRVMSGDFDALIARIGETPVPDGGYECNPITSVPELVESVGNALDLDQNAAALYLQLATLADPKDKKIKAWNGWSSKVHRKAQQALVDRELVLEAKRSRAGRGAFVPGGWEKLKSPHAPIETWKLPLYGVERGADDNLIMPLGFIVPLRPIHELFATAWARIESGDKPRYEEPGK
jgi:hypothetical protein